MSKKYKCELCNVEINNIARVIRKHKLTKKHRFNEEHPDDDYDKKECLVCNVEFKNKINYRTHLKSLRHKRKVENPDLPAFICEHRHMRYNCLKCLKGKYRCEICERDYTTKPIFETHLESVKHWKAEQTAKWKLKNNL